MTRIVDDVRAVLATAGFTTIRLRPDSAILYFEDESIMGQVHIVDSAEDVVARWKSIQDEFLAHNAPRFVRDPGKAWNIYTVILAAGTQSTGLMHEFVSIEEDFRGTRKIVRGGVETKSDVVGALAPILPLRNISRVEAGDLRGRLEHGLGSIAPPLEQLVGDVSTEWIGESLVDEK